jgi:signal transduction histidine kinase/ActR/RegA family two-component response regulator
LHPEDLPLVEAESRRCALARKPFEMQYRIVWPDGSPHWVESKGVFLCDGEGKAIRKVGVVMDITERKRIEDALRLSHSGLERRVIERTLELEKANVDLQKQINERIRSEEERVRVVTEAQQAQKMQALGQLAGGVAHDFNNQLAVIAGYCGLILNGESKPDEIKDWLQEVRRATEDASGLSRQLLTFSRKQIIEPVVVSPNAPIRKMAKMLRSALGENIELILRLDEDAGRILIDPAQLSQAILNLAFNSRDAMPKGGRLTVETSNLSAPQDEARLAPGEYVQISVSDTGTGIPKEIQDKVFDPFFTTKPQGQGTGLGLAMVYGTVKQQEGEIFLHSEPGAGTTMRLCFKRAAGAPQADSSSDQAPQRRSGRGERILLVEDETRVRKVMEEMLRHAGYNVVATASAEEALARFSADDSFALVLTDVIMPGKSGVELAARLREKAPGLPFIFCSGYAGDLLAAGGTDHGDVPLLSKPVDPVRLFKTMRELIDAAARPGQNRRT